MPRASNAKTPGKTRGKSRPEAGADPAGICRECGCTNDRACAGGCYWVDESETLCSACAAPEDLAPDDALAQLLGAMDGGPGGYEILTWGFDPQGNKEALRVYPAADFDVHAFGQEWGGGRYVAQVRNTQTKQIKTQRTFRVSDRIKAAARPGAPTPAAPAPAASAENRVWELMMLMMQQQHAATLAHASSQTALLTAVLTNKGGDVAEILKIVNASRGEKSDVLQLVEGMKAIQDLAGGMGNNGGAGGGEDGVWSQVAAGVVQKLLDQPEAPAQPAAPPHHPQQRPALPAAGQPRPAAPAPQNSSPSGAPQGVGATPAPTPAAAADAELKRVSAVLAEIHRQLERGAQIQDEPEVAERYALNIGDTLEQAGQKPADLLAGKLNFGGKVLEWGKGAEGELTTWLISNSPRLAPFQQFISDVEIELRAMYVLVPGPVEPAAPEPVTPPTSEAGTAAA